MNYVIGWFTGSVLLLLRQRVKLMIGKKINGIILLSDFLGLWVYIYIRQTLNYLNKGRLNVRVDLLHA